VALTETLLFFVPAVVPWTVTVTVHEVFGAMLAPLRLTLEEPSVAVAVPLQVVLRLPGVATTRPVGRLSVNAVPFSVMFWLLLLSIVMVRLVVPFSGIEAAPNSLAICGGLMTTTVAVEALVALPASLESRVTLLVYLLSTALDTLTVMVHVPVGWPDGLL